MRRRFNKLAATILFSLSFLFIFLTPTFAEEVDRQLPAITIINPLRGNELGHEGEDLSKSLRAQWKITKDAGVNATWLWQYGSLENEKMTSFAKTEMQNQEFGIWLEIDRNYAQKASVQFRGQGPWYFSDGLLLSSYDVADRKKLIDTVFSKFKETFGYYPKTVGSWWVGADSLVYMQKKYGIVASLKAADQFDLDMYSIWGAPWNISYVPSIENESIPADSLGASSKVVILQWAARDPTRGIEDPLYSVQDFPARGLDLSYVDYMVSIFLKEPTDNLVFGLENGGNLETFSKYYEKMVKKARKLEEEKKVKVMLVGEYAGQFLARGDTFAATRYFLAKDFLNDDQSFWYHSENYRVSIKKSDDKIYLTDLHIYTKKTQEDFAILPNSQATLRIDSPVAIDAMRFLDQKRLIAKSDRAITVKEKNDFVALYAGEKKIAQFTPLEFILFDGSSDKLIEEFSKNNKAVWVDITLILFGIFFSYFLFVFLKYRNSNNALIQISLLTIPLYFAYPFLSQGMSDDITFLFDKKQILLLNLIGNPAFLSTAYLILIFQVFPFIVLLFSHYLFMFNPTVKKYKYIFIGIVSVVILFYAHVPYFPLDRSTYLIVLLCFGLLGIILFICSILFYKKTKNKKRFSIALASILFILVLFAGIMFISRTKYALTPFEIDAMQAIKNKDKDVLLVIQEGGIKPIYKAVRPAIYENNALAEKLTGRNWEVVFRPTNHILNITDYDDKLVMVPRYTGGDLSPHEEQELNLKKIFDNAQIAIYEKE